ncbi:putative signal transducing protein [Luteimonas panaciterrae]|uniref:putative signal transducing protein n=1 Tax=Luteimonas panaciterrae TaxID=363885 RepID=UPI001CFAA28A|nr:DUF2007 domain-containing protein [Luteimonas panaciterrae]
MLSERYARRISTGMFTTIAHYTDPIEAHLARGLLLSEGIEAHLDDEHLAYANWEWRLATGGVKLRVLHIHAERARAVLRAMEAGDYALDEDGDARDPGLQSPYRESWSSRLAWLALMLYGIPLPWRRRHDDEDAARVERKV